MNLRRTAALARACHPGPCVAVTAFSSALALAAGRGVGTLWVAAAVLSGHTSVGWGNDWLDAGRDRAAARADKPVAAGEVSERAVRAAALSGLVLCAPLSVAAGGWDAAAVHLLAVGIAWAYNLGLKATWASPLPYAGAFALLPVFVAACVDGTAPWWAVSGAALLGAGAHFTNALPDLDADEATGVRGLPQRLGRRGAILAAAVLLLAGVAAIALGHPGLPPAAAGAGAAVALALVAAVVIVGWRAASRAAFTLTMVAAGALVALILASGPALS